MSEEREYRPHGVTTLTPYLAVRGAAKAIDFYKKAFDARELSRFEGDGGRVDHATILIGDATVYLADESDRAPSPQALGGTPMVFHMYVPDCDAVYERALAAGARSIAPVADQEWGDRYGQVEDPFGYRWGIATMQAHEH